MSELIVYQPERGEGGIEVRLDGHTVWLSLGDMVALFGRDKSTVSRHLKNVFSDKELDRSSVVAFFATTAADGKTYQVEYFNLDVIISIGYRVKSPQGVRFRQWATRTLRAHLLERQDAPRAGEIGMAEFELALGLVERTLIGNELVNDVGREVLRLVADYAKTWRLLLKYDEDGLALPAGVRPARGVLALDEARRAIAALRQELMARGEASELFGRERGDGLDAILGALEQTMFGESLYPSAEERAAHLLYFVIKDHPFSDGNKRSGAFLFLLYLRQEGLPLRLDANALTALTLLIAESDAKAKDLMIRLVTNLLAG